MHPVKKWDGQHCDFSLNGQLLISSIPQWVVSFSQQPLLVSFSEIVGSAKLRKGQHKYKNRKKLWRGRAPPHFSFTRSCAHNFFLIVLHFCVTPTVLSKSLEQTSDNEFYLHKNENRQRMTSLWERGEGQLRNRMFTANDNIARWVTAMKTFNISKEKNTTSRKPKQVNALLFLLFVSYKFFQEDNLKIWVVVDLLTHTSFLVFF